MKYAALMFFSFFPNSIMSWSTWEGFVGWYNLFQMDTFKITCSNWLQKNWVNWLLAAEGQLPFKAGNPMTMYRWYNMVVWGLLSKLGAWVQMWGSPVTLLWLWVKFWASDQCGNDDDSLLLQEESGLYKCVGC